MPHRNGPDVFFSFPGRKGSVSNVLINFPSQQIDANAKKNLKPIISSLIFISNELIYEQISKQMGLHVLTTVAYVLCV